MSDTAGTSETFVTPVMRSSYNNYFTARLRAKPKPGDKARYSGTGLILPPDKMATDVDRERWSGLLKGINAVGVKAMGEDKYKTLYADGKIKMPIHKDIKSSGFPDDFACYIRAWSYQQPGVVSIYRDPITKKPATITDPNQVFSGCWVRFSVRPWCFYHEEGGWSIGLTLQNVQWVKDDVRLDGRSAATDDFDAEAEMPEGMLLGDGGSRASDKDELASLLGG